MFIPSLHTFIADADWYLAAIKSMGYHKKMSGDTQVMQVRILVEVRNIGRNTVPGEMMASQQVLNQTSNSTNFRDRLMEKF